MSKEVSAGVGWVSLLILIYITCQPTVTHLTGNEYRVKYIGYNPYFCDKKVDEVICRAKIEKFIGAKQNE